MMMIDQNNLSDADIRLLISKNRRILDVAMDVTRTRLDAFEAQLTKDTQRKVAAFDALRRMCGYVENGSDTTVRMFQDDATKTWCIVIGSYHDRPTNKSHHGASLLDAIETAVKAGAAEVE